MASSCRYLPRLAVLVALAGAVGAAGCSADDPPRMGAVCVPGNQRCSENRFQTCASDGDSWVTSLDCVAEGLLCFPGVGCKTCSPGVVQCGGDGFDIVR